MEKKNIAKTSLCLAKNCSNEHAFAEAQTRIIGSASMKYVHIYDSGICHLSCELQTDKTTGGCCL